MSERASERGLTRKINKNTCEEEPSDNKDTGQNIKTYKCFLTVAMKMKQYVECRLHNNINLIRLAKMLKSIGAKTIA